MTDRVLPFICGVCHLAILRAMLTDGTNREYIVASLPVHINDKKLCALEHTSVLK